MGELEGRAARQQGQQVPGEGRRRTGTDQEGARPRVSAEGAASGGRRQLCRDAHQVQQAQHSARGGRHGFKLCQTVASAVAIKIIIFSKASSKFLKLYLYFVYTYFFLL